MKTVQKNIIDGKQNLIRLARVLAQTERGYLQTLFSGSECHGVPKQLWLQGSIVNFVNPWPQSITFRFLARDISHSEEILLTDCWIVFGDPLPDSLLSKSPDMLRLAGRKFPSFTLFHGGRCARASQCCSSRIHLFDASRVHYFASISGRVKEWHSSTAPACACQVLLLFLLASCVRNSCWKPVHCLWR